MAGKMLLPIVIGAGAIALLASKKKGNGNGNGATTGVVAEGSLLNNLNIPHYWRVESREGPMPGFGGASHFAAQHKSVRGSWADVGVYATAEAAQDAAISHVVGLGFDKEAA